MLTIADASEGRPEALGAVLPETPWVLRPAIRVAAGLCHCDAAVCVTVFVDSEIGDWESSELVEALACVMCRCGNTLAVGTESTEPADRRILFGWVRQEVNRKGVKPSAVVDELMAKLQ